MPLPENAQTRLAEAKERFSVVGPHMRPEDLRTTISQLEEEMGATGFWDNQETASKISSDHSRATRKLQQHDKLESDLEDLDGLFEMAAEDEDLVDEVMAQLKSVEKTLAVVEEQQLFSGPYDAGDALISIQAGAGGTDAQDWAEGLLRMEMRWAESRGMKVQLLEVSEGVEAGIKSATFRASGENAYGLFCAERGVHRMVRISQYDSQKRRQTAFAGLEVAPVVDEIGNIEIRDEDLRVDTYRSSGAGGQHVNKTDSAVRLTHLPTGIVVACQDGRSQTANKETAMKMLAAKLLERAERERAEEIAKEKGEAENVGWGSRIRSYVLYPYSNIKDDRTGVETGNVQAVLDGDLDQFVHAWLVLQAGKLRLALRRISPSTPPSRT